MCVFFEASVVESVQKGCLVASAAEEIVVKGAIKTCLQ